MVVLLTYCNNLLVEGHGGYNGCTGWCTEFILVNVLSLSPENTSGVRKVPKLRPEQVHHFRCGCMVRWYSAGAAWREVYTKTQAESGKSRNLAIDMAH